MLPGWQLCLVLYSCLAVWKSMHWLRNQLVCFCYDFKIENQDVSRTFDRFEEMCSASSLGLPNARLLSASWKSRQIPLGSFTHSLHNMKYFWHFRWVMSVNREKFKPACHYPSLLSIDYQLQCFSYSLLFFWTQISSWNVVQWIAQNFDFESTM